MKDLSKMAGLPIYLSENGLIFGNSVSRVKSRVRQINDLRDVWLDKSIRGRQTVYITYLGVYKLEHQVIFEKIGLEHGYVVMFPGIYGREYAKQYGHYHSLFPQSSLAFPEFYAVLNGTGDFLLQKAALPYSEIEDTVLIEGVAGDRIIVPPGYGHLTINAGNEILVFEGFFAKNLVADYEPYKQKQGGAYYEVMENGIKKVVPNKNYDRLPVMRKVRAGGTLRLEDLKSGICYQKFIKNPNIFNFLVDPRKYR